MNETTVAVVQMNAHMENLKYNIIKHEQITQEAVAAGANFIFFPELSVTAHYGNDSVVDLAEKVDNGIIHDTFLDIASKLNCTIGYGMCEQGNGVFYNSYVIMGPLGICGLQRKVHASLDEYLHFRMGSSFPIISVGDWKIGVAICVDAAYFEVWRILALNGADLIILPHAGRNGSGIEISEETQRMGLERRLKAAPDRYGVYASDNSVFAAFCNQVGYNGHSTHAGGAWIAGPDGKLLVCTEPVLSDTFVLSRLDPSALHVARRKKSSTLRTRRPDMYKDLIRL
jgi:predicted amidohydrolase